MAIPLLAFAISGVPIAIRAAAPWVIRSMKWFKNGKGIHVIGTSASFIAVSEAVWEEFDPDGMLTEEMEDYVYNTILLSAGLEAAELFKNAVGAVKGRRGLGDKKRVGITKRKAATISAIVKAILNFPTLGRFAKRFSRQRPATGRTTVVRDPKKGSILVTTDGIPRIFVDASGFRVNGSLKGAHIVAGTTLGIAALSAPTSTAELDVYMEMLAGYAETIFGDDDNDTTNPELATGNLVTTQSPLEALHYSQDPRNMLLTAVSDPHFFISQMTNNGIDAKIALDTWVTIVTAGTTLSGANYLLVDRSSDPLTDDDEFVDEDDSWWDSLISFFSGEEEEGEDEGTPAMTNEQKEKIVEDIISANRDSDNATILGSAPSIDASVSPTVSASRVIPSSVSTGSF